MTTTEAMEVLSKRPLTFGDVEQIKAHQFLEQVALAQESYTNCVEEHDEESVWDCPCMRGFSFDVIEQFYLELVGS